MSNYQQLKMAQQQFGMSKDAVHKFGAAKAGSEMLIPLTEALFVPAQVADSSKVLVEYGANYFVERKTEAAEEFFDRKIKFLADRTKELENAIRSKRDNHGAVTQILQQKVKEASEAAGQ